MQEILQQKNWYWSYITKFNQERSSEQNLAQQKVNFQMEELKESDRQEIDNIIEATKNAQLLQMQKPTGEQN